MKGGSGHGLGYVEGAVTGPTGKQATLKFLIDSGAKYTLLPYDVWHDIGLEPAESLTFILADGTEVDSSVSECRITLAQGSRHTPGILGEKGDEQALLGGGTLEELHLVLNP